MWEHPLMGWQQFVSSLVASLAWPIAVVVAVFVLRKPLGELLGRIRRGSLAGVTVDLDVPEKVQEAAGEAASTEIDETKVLAPTADDSDRSRLRAAIKADELRRRPWIEALVEAVFKSGWTAGRMGVTPVPGIKVEWEDITGRPSVTFFKREVDYFLTADGEKLAPERLMMGQVKHDL